MTIRLEQPHNDADWLRARSLIEAYAASLGFDLAFQGFDEELERLATEYAAPSGAFLVASDDVQGLGCVGLRRFDDTTGEIKRLYVAPAARGRGVGRMLAQGIVAHGRTLGYRRLVLDTVSTMHEAQGLYTSLGFSPIPPYRYNPLPDAAYYELRLR
jgi:GNAT superfamily N-acetyltransferase